ncbi:hypothetical protein D3C72_2193170 [compost metagenome]
MVVPVSLLSISPARWALDPTPSDPTLTLPGCFFAYAISSGTLLAGRSLRAISTSALLMARLTGARLRWGSYGSFAYMLLLIARVTRLPKPIV